MSIRNQNGPLATTKEQIAFLKAKAEAYLRTMPERLEKLRQEAPYVSAEELAKQGQYVHDSSTIRRSKPSTKHIR
jgi:hypothetical protein